MFILFPKYKLRLSVFAIPAAIVLYWCEGGLPFLILFSSALFHEMGHLAAIKLFGYQTRRIDILPMGALIVLPEGIPYEKEWKIAIAGPMFSFVLASVSLVSFSLCPILPFLYSVVINFVLALFNLLPIKLLDGGNALRCFLLSRVSQKNELYETAEKKTERICSVMSHISLISFALIMTLCLFAVGHNIGAALLVIVLMVQLTGKL